MVTLKEKTGLLPDHKLPTNLTTRNFEVHRWFNFIAGFSPEFVAREIVSAKLKPGSSLLDPFAGAGTALVEANSLGLNAIGFEPQPFFYEMALAKTQTRSTENIKEVGKLLKSAKPLKTIEELWTSDSQIVFLSKLVDEENLLLLGGMRKQLKLCSESSKPIFKLIVSRLLEAAAGSQTDGIYKAPSSLKKSRNVLDLLTTLLIDCEQDILAMPEDSGDSVIYKQSSETMSMVHSGSQSICITSPPYLNNFDFAEMSRMEFYFWGIAENWGEITKLVRRNLIINTTTAPSLMRKDQSRWNSILPADFIDDINPLIDSLQLMRSEKAGKKEYDSLVAPYFAQMYSVLGEAYRVLKNGAPLHLIVADAALYGVHIKTEELLASLMSTLGFEIVAVHRLRDRGGRWVLDKRQGPGVPLGEFHIHAVKRRGKSERR